MKDLFVDASKSSMVSLVAARQHTYVKMIQDFPRTLDERVYHLGVKAGEVANRIVSSIPTFSVYSIRGKMDTGDCWSRFKGATYC